MGTLPSFSLAGLYSKFGFQRLLLFFEHTACAFCQSKEHKSFLPIRFAKRENLANRQTSKQIPTGCPAYRGREDPA